MARVIAHRRPAMVRQVITLGAPFSGTPRSTRVWRIYEYLSGHKIDDPVALGYMGEAAQQLRARRSRSSAASGSAAAGAIGVGSAGGSCSSASEHDPPPHESRCGSRGLCGADGGGEGHVDRGRMRGPARAFACEARLE
jgi:hypothetical protein